MRKIDWNTYDFAIGDIKHHAKRERFVNEFASLAHTARNAKKTAKECEQAGIDSGFFLSLIEDCKKGVISIFSKTI